MAFEIVIPGSASRNGQALCHTTWSSEMSVKFDMGNCVQEGRVLERTVKKTQGNTLNLTDLHTAGS